MKKTKIIIYSLGGFFAAVSLVLGWFIWSAYEELEENRTDLQDQIGIAGRLTRLPIYPGQESVDATEANRFLYEGWTSNSLKVASQGDYHIEPISAPAFKTRLIDDAKWMSLLPGGVDGKIVKPDFPFGFKDFIIGGVLPSAANLPRLQREWRDVTNVVSILAAAGIVELESIEIAKPVETPVAQPRKVSRSATKRGAKAKTGEVFSERSNVEPMITTMAVEFRTSPEGLVGVLNRLVSGNRFITVEAFSFAREKDEVAEKLGGDQKKLAQKAKRKLSPAERRREQRKAAEEAEAAIAESANTAEVVVVSDPQSIAPFKVKMKLQIYDFLSDELAVETAGEEE